MESMKDVLHLLVIFVLLSCKDTVLAGSYCAKYDYWNSYNSFYDTEYVYCAFGCCSNRSLDPCCSSTGYIIGFVVSSLVLLGIIIACICCCKRRRASAGQVMQPTSGTVVTYNTVDQQGRVVYPPPQQYPSYPAQPQPYPPQPQPYGGYPVNQPPMGYPQQNITYPPPQAVQQKGYITQPPYPIEESQPLTRGYPQSQPSAPPLTGNEEFRYSDATSEKSPLK